MVSEGQVRKLGGVDSEQLSLLNPRRQGTQTTYLKGDDHPWQLEGKPDFSFGLQR